MTHTIKKLVAASLASLASASALAAPVTEPNDGQWPLTINFEASVDLRAGLDTVEGSVSAVGPGKVTTVYEEYQLMELEVATPLNTLVYDDAAQQVLGAAGNGGFTMTAPVKKGVSSGGSLSITDLNLDLTNQKVYATVAGANGVGTLSNLYLFDVADVSSRDLPAIPLTPPPGFTYDAITLSGLSLTQMGFDTFAKSLGLVSLGRGALQTVTSFGSITVTVVPEPSSMILSGLGLSLLSVGVARSRRRNRTDAPVAA